MELRLTMLFRILFFLSFFCAISAKTDDIRCFVCSSYMEQCRHYVETHKGYAHRGRCHSKCFVRLGEDGAIYRGCFDGFREVPYLTAEYEGCRNQTWNGQSLPWCFCSTDLCNKVAIKDLKKLKDSSVSDEESNQVIRDDRADKRQLNKDRYEPHAKEGGRHGDKGFEIVDVQYGGYDDKAYNPVSDYTSLYFNGPDVAMPEHCMSAISGYDAYYDYYQVDDAPAYDVSHVGENGGLIYGRDFPAQPASGRAHVERSNHVNVFSSPDVFKSTGLANDHNKQSDSGVKESSRVSQDKPEVENAYQNKQNRPNYGTERNKPLSQSQHNTVNTDSNDSYRTRNTHKTNEQFDDSSNLPIRHTNDRRTTDKNIPPQRQTSSAQASGSNHVPYPYYDYEYKDPALAYNEIDKKVNVDQHQSNEVPDQPEDPYYFPPHLADRIECAQTGFYQNPDDCRTFVACILDAYVRRPYMHLMRCPQGLVWDNTDKICNQYSSTCNVAGKFEDDSRDRVHSQSQPLADTKKTSGGHII